MQQWSSDGVRGERTGWRDKDLSLRHRDWGFNCPAVDLDFLMVEYNLGLPVGLIEYKHHRAKMPNVQHATYRALSALAETSALPFCVAFYWPEDWSFRVYPVNATAGRHFTSPEDMSEYEFVSRLYRLRRLVLNQALAGRLNRTRPPAEVA
jgi:hypothetical protein